MRSRTAARAVLLASVVCVTSAACSLAVSTEGLSGGSGAPEVDAAREVGVDAARDDVSVPDATNEATELPFCARRAHTLCEDFDDATSTRVTQLLRNGGVITIDADAVSPPSAAACSVPVSVGGNTSARVVGELPLIPPTVHVEFDTKLCTPPSSGGLEFFKLEFDNEFEAKNVGFGDAAIALGTADGNFEAALFGWLAGGTTFERFEALPKQASGVWHHVEVDAKLSTTAGDLTVTIDGVRVLELKGARTMTDGAKGMRVIVGTYTQAAPTACTVSIDNLAVDNL